VCTPAHQYFSCITTLHCATPNLSAHTHACQYFPCITTLHCAMPNLSAHTHAPIFFMHYHSAPRNAKFKCAHRVPNIFPCIPNLYSATPNFSVHSHTPLFSTHHKIFTVHHAFLVCTPAHIHFYVHQFLVNSVAEIGAFAKLFPNFHHRHSATMKFVQFHPDNTNSTSTTTNHCWLTFLEQFFPNSIHKLRILIN
jgi:hypothetical protein